MVVLAYAVECADDGAYSCVRILLCRCNLGVYVISRVAEDFFRPSPVEELPIEVGETKVSFPWFAGTPAPEEVKAYDHFICALCEMARNQKRVTAKERDTGNDKYAFRCFLLRLGFIGPEYKQERKILLRNLTGSSAFKTVPQKEVADDAASE